MSRRYERYDPRDDPREAPRERTTAQYVREVRRGDERHYDTHLSTHAQDLIPRPREDSDFSVEEIRRDFPPPGYTRDINWARSTGPYDEDYNRRSHYARDDDYDRRSHYTRDDYYDRRSKKPASVSEYEGNKRARVLGKQEQILAALVSAGVAMGATYGARKYMDKKAGKEETGPTQQDILASVAVGAAGAFAGYQGAEYYNKHQRDKLLAHRGGYVSDEDEDPKETKGRKNFLESALGAAGLGGAIKAMTGGSSHDDKKSDTRSRAGSSRSRSRSKGRGDGSNKIQKAAMASLIAGATEAFRVSKEPGGWKGEKAKRIFTAAAGAATIDAAQNPDKSSKLSLAESVIGGLVGNRVLHGSKKNIEEDKKTGRSRSRSRARSEGGAATGLAALATAGLGAFGAKKIMENRDRSRSRRPGDSDDSRASSPDKRRRSRSRSVVDGARRSLARIGLGNGPDDDRDDDHRRRRHHDDGSDDDDDDHRGSRRHRRRDSDDDDYDDRRRGNERRDKDRDRNYDRERSRSRGGGQRRRGSPSESDLGDSDEDRKEARKKRGKQILTMGLAGVATIHAANNVYQSMEKRNSRHKAVKEGRLSPEEAKKLKSKALWQDAASVGIAALGIKGAISELKEAKEMSHEWKEWKAEKEARHKRRLERQKRLAGADYYHSDDGGYYDRHRTDQWSSTAPPKVDRYDEGPRYVDGNPYSAALPAPPVGRSDRSERR